ncbi:hypothetical protein ACLB2K_017780 [Fragaria x ananassa]
MSILLKSPTPLFLFFFFFFTFGNSRLPRIPLAVFFSGGEYEYFKAVLNPDEAVKREQEYRGRWELVSDNSGVSAMHMIIMPNSNKAIMFDAAGFGPSGISLPAGDCRRVLDSRKEDEVYELDCWAHAVEFDIDTAAIRPLKIHGAHLGGYQLMVHLCKLVDGMKEEGLSDTSMDAVLAIGRSTPFSTQHILPNGDFIVVGGRHMFNYEYIPKAAGTSNEKSYVLPFLQETNDSVENNLYPFVVLSTDGNLLIFANSRSILLNPTTNKVVRELPVLEGGSRNYPASGMAALLPIKLNDLNSNVLRAEILVCGGADPRAGKFVENGIYVTALQDCGRIDITNPKATWQKEMMPTPRIMGDMVVLPTGDVLMINGAKKGTAGLNFAEDPNVIPVIYKPDNPMTRRFMELRETTIPRMYGSTSALLPDGTILVAGSNPNFYYNFTGVKYPTELRVEKFYPTYFDPERVSDRVVITSNYEGKMVNYGHNFLIEFQVKKVSVDLSDLKVTMYAPPFTTHGFSMGQRHVELVVAELKIVEFELFRVEVAAPPTAEIAPLGFYLVFVVHVGVPSSGIWLQIA